MKQLAQKLVPFLSALVLMVGPVSASDAPTSTGDQQAVIRAVALWMDGINAGKVPTSVCSQDAVILDEFPPHIWQGANACDRWVADLTAFNQSIGLTNGKTKRGKPRRIDVSGDVAYVVLPVDFTYEEHGKAGAELGALFTVALRREQAGWRITGWAWSRP